MAAAGAHRQADQSAQDHGISCVSTSVAKLGYIVERTGPAGRRAKSGSAGRHIKSHPAESVDPSDRANQPFMTMPTTAKAMAAVDKRTGTTGRRDGLTARNVTVGGALSN